MHAGARVSAHAGAKVCACMCPSACVRLRVHVPSVICLSGYSFFNRALILKPSVPYLHARVRVRVRCAQVFFRGVNKLIVAGVKHEGYSTYS